MDAYCAIVETDKFGLLDGIAVVVTPENKQQRVQLVAEAVEGAADEQAAKDALSRLAHAWGLRLITEPDHAFPKATRWTLAAR